MIKTEVVTIREKQYRRTWSDTGFMIEREGARYGGAIDPSLLSANVYTPEQYPRGWELQE